VAELGGHLLVGVTHSNISALRIDSEQLVVGSLQACADTDCVPFIIQAVFIDPLLSLEVLPDVPVYIARSGMGIGACWKGE
jgi:hypothetical protein